MLSWTEAEPLLDAFDVPIPDTRLATSLDEAVDHDKAIGHPVVLKVYSRDIPHRTDDDTARVGLDGPNDVLTAYREILSKADEYEPDAEIAGVLVQRQHDGEWKRSSASPRSPVSGRW